MSLLNGKNDKPFPKANEDESISFREVRKQTFNFCNVQTFESRLIRSYQAYVLASQKERFKDNDKNKAVFSVKIKALKVMDLFFNFRFYLRLQVSTIYPVTGIIAF